MGDVYQQGFWQGGQTSLTDQGTLKGPITLAAPQSGLDIHRFAVSVDLAGTGQPAAVLLKSFKNAGVPPDWSVNSVVPGN